MCLWFGHMKQSTLCSFKYLNLVIIQSFFNKQKGARSVSICQPFLVFVYCYRKQQKNSSVYSFSNTTVQYTGVATHSALAALRGCKETWSSSVFNLLVDESFCPAEGRVSPLTVLTQPLRGPLTSLALVSILTVWMRQDALAPLHTVSTRLCTLIICLTWKPQSACVGMLRGERECVVGSKLSFSCHSRWSLPFWFANWYL